MTVNSLEDKVIDSARYQIGELIGRGCWGAVYEAKDTQLDRTVAIKVLDPNEIALDQMAERNLDAQKAMKKEEAELKACSNVVPRQLLFDNDGKPFVVMPRYHQFFSHVLCDDGIRRYLNNGLKFNQIASYLSDLTNGLVEMHHKLRRVHGDIKGDNVAIDRDGNLLLNDFGSSTLSSWGMSASPRDNIGFLYTRAPECFKEDGHPSKESDVWAFGSLVYRLFTGKYIFEDELENAKDPSLLMEQISDVADKIINQKIKKNIPKGFRKFLKKCLAFRTYDRFSGSTQLKIELDKVMENLNGHNRLKKYVKQAAILSIPLAMFGFITYSAAIHVPDELAMPEPIQQEGRANIEDLPISFVRENLNLPNVNPQKEHNDYIRLATDNKYVAYLLRAYDQTVSTVGDPNKEYVTKTQFETWFCYTSSSEREIRRVDAIHDAATRCIEVGIAKSKTPEGKVDLEDVCAIARLGEDKVNEARRAANSFEFKNYIQAKDNNGSFIIPQREQEFIKTWLAYAKY